MDITTFFKTKVRGSDGVQITVLTEDAPDWMREMVVAVHRITNELPCDWIYDKVAAIVDILEEERESVDQRETFEIAWDLVDDEWGCWQWASPLKWELIDAEYNVHGTHNRIRHAQAGLLEQYVQQVEAFIDSADIDGMA